MLWGLEPVKQQAAYDLAVNQVKRMIHMGLLLPEERMLSERRLADQFSISRVTLREALRILQTEGYINIKRGTRGGAVITEESKLQEIARRHITRDPSGVLRVFEFRVALEPVGAELAALRRTPADTKHFSQAINEIAGASSLGELQRGETAFHLAVSEASSNPFISNAVEDALAAFFMPLKEGDFATQRQNSLEMREAVIVAIQKRQQGLARQGMERVIQFERNRLPDKEVA